MLSPIDTRYSEKTEALFPYFSERALAHYRVKMEGEYLIALRGEKAKKVRKIYDISEKDFKRICDIEKVTDHDVKAVEYFIKEKLKDPKLTEWVHFALTSEDVNNIAYSLMIKDSLDKVLKPKVKEIIKEIDNLAKKHRALPMLARTHGQPASPTTFGKEMKVFAVRLEKGLKALSEIKIEAKLNGATGNWNAHLAAFPKTDWQSFSKRFIKSLGLEPNMATTQIEPHDSWASVFDALKRLNTILIDFDQDIWRYISDEWIVQKPKEGTVGSSTMPHKINPIKFENSEGNLGLANALLEFLSRKLPISRLQRDLSDSTVERNIGVAFAHSLVAYEYLLAGLSRIDVNAAKMKDALENHPEVIAEAIQTVLRREGVAMPYEKLKALTRGRKVTLKDLHAFIDELHINKKTKAELKKITPSNYIGLASRS